MFDVGMDEAGFGPNLGPLVIAVSEWHRVTPEDDPQTWPFDLWNGFEAVATQQRRLATDRLHIADSKEVHSSAKGIAALERSAFACCLLAGWEPTSLQDLATLLTGRPQPLAVEPWFEEPLTIPIAIDPQDLSPILDRWRSLLDEHRVSPPLLRADLVLTERYNDLVEREGTKGRALSTTSLSLMRPVWNSAVKHRGRIVCDKHGGRNRYDALIADSLVGTPLDNTPVMCRREGRASSLYVVNGTEIEFRMRAEAHFAVAVASLVAKYLRELSMIAFNRFWQRQLPGLRPTKGYPVDAKRFLDAIESQRELLGIPLRHLWRDR